MNARQAAISCLFVSAAGLLACQPRAHPHQADASSRAASVAGASLTELACAGDKTALSDPFYDTMARELIRVTNPSAAGAADAYAAAKIALTAVPRGLLTTFATLPGRITIANNTATACGAASTVRSCYTVSQVPDNANKAVNRMLTEIILKNDPARTPSPTLTRS